MKSAAIVWAAAKAALLASAATLAVALLFGGISEFGARVFENPYSEQWATTRQAFRFWTTWWFVIFGTIFAPLWVVSFVYFIRRFALPGYRVAAAGYFVAFYGSLGVVLVLAYYLGAVPGATQREAMLDLALPVGILGIGLLLAYRCRKAT